MCDIGRCLNSLVLLHDGDESGVVGAFEDLSVIDVLVFHGFCEIRDGVSGVCECMCCCTWA